MAENVCAVFCPSFGAFVFVIQLLCSHCKSSQNDSSGVNWFLVEIYLFQREISPEMFAGRKASKIQFAENDSSSEKKIKSEIANSSFPVNSRRERMKAMAFLDLRALLGISTRATISFQQQQKGDRSAIFQLF